MPTAGCTMKRWNLSQKWTGWRKEEIHLLVEGSEDNQEEESL
jgi:hypothetical protein